MDRMDFSFIEKIKAWLIFLPCLTMAFNCLGLPLSIWAAVTWYNDTGNLPSWCFYWSIANIGLFAFFTTGQYCRTWLRTKLVMERPGSGYGTCCVSTRCLCSCGGCSGQFRCGSATACIATTWRLVWERTLKKDDNRLLVRDRVAQGTLGYAEPKLLEYKASRAA